MLEDVFDKNQEAGAMFGLCLATHPAMIPLRRRAP
jgi:hypothetical protein